MKVLLLGSGGREHAMAWKIAQSPQCDQLFIAPGNPGTAQVGTNLPVKATDFPALADTCLVNAIDMVVVGPEDPLVLGVVDYFRQREDVKHIPVIGPDRKAAQMEGSKAFAKAFMQRNGVQTPAYKVFADNELNEAETYLRSHAMPVVLKADGLAAGKGVVICSTHEEAINELHQILNGKFGSAGNKLVVEQFLTGIELTVIILTDGEHYLVLPPAKDYKKIGDGDTGLNTGGMGAISPPPFVTDDFLQKIKEKIIQPTIAGLKKEEIHYSGFLYFGLFKCGDEPFVIEFNARLGDPETQVILPRIKNDMLDLFKACADGSLNLVQVETDARTCATVILASHGYPEQFEKNRKITGLENTENCMVFLAGTVVGDNNDLLTAGGRVLAISAYGTQLPDALRICYANAGRIYYETRYFRRDIGWDVV